MQTLIKLAVYLALMMPCSVIGANPEWKSFTWGKVTYVNLVKGEKYDYQDHEIELLAIKNHYNLVRVGEDTIWLKVSRRTPARSIGGVQLFVADNRIVKAISPDTTVHGLLHQDILLALAPGGEPMTDPLTFGFPVSYTDGFVWRIQNDRYMFAYPMNETNPGQAAAGYAGVGIDLRNARASQKHLVVAMEAGRVAWVENRRYGTEQPQAAICIESESSPGIFYIYEYLHERFLFVKRNQRVRKGDALGYIWGDQSWEHLRIGVVKSDTLPGFDARHANSVNFYPQLMDAYFGRQPLHSNSFTKGQIEFGRSKTAASQVVNNTPFEEFLGTGWIIGKWNPADALEWVASRRSSNVRMSNTLFRGQKAQCSPPGNQFVFEINVRPGIYRIRANIGDALADSWQKVEFEDVNAGTYNLGQGEFSWTPERIVKVNDGKLSVRVHVADNGQPAGISQIVFQIADN